MANVFVWTLAGSAAIGLVLVALDGLDAIHLHQSARDARCHRAARRCGGRLFRSGQQKPRQVAAAAAALLGALLAMVGTTTFLERAGRDPFLVASGPVRWVSIHDAPVAQFDVPFEIDDLRLSPHGRLVALQPTEEDSRRGEPQVFHVGLSDGTLTRIEATDIAFIDDQRALVLAIREGSAELQDMRFGGRPAICGAGRSRTSAGARLASIQPRASGSSRDGIVAAA